MTGTVGGSDFQEVDVSSSTVSTYLYDVDACTVCTSSECDEDNPMVYCDTCNMPVHKECYGTPLSLEIPSDEWHCNRCIFINSYGQNPHNYNSSYNSTIQCCLCGNSDGAMKHTTDYQWCHISCALWVPETFFRSSESRDYIDILQIPAYKFHRQCYICNNTYGCAIECSNIGCENCFHVTCGLREGTLLEYRESGNKNIPDTIISTCTQHSKNKKKR